MLGFTAAYLLFVNNHLLIVYELAHSHFISL